MTIETTDSSDLAQEGGSDESVMAQLA
jgi:hypothetical protein